MKTRRFRGLFAAGILAGDFTRGAVDASLDILKLDQILADAFTHEHEEAAAEGILATEVAALEKGLPELERTVHHASALRDCAVAKARLTLFEGVLKHLQMLQSRTDQLAGKSLALKVTGAGLAAKSRSSNRFSSFLRRFSRLILRIPAGLPMSRLR